VKNRVQDYMHRAEVLKPFVQAIREKRAKDEMKSEGKVLICSTCVSRPSLWSCF